ncbi:MAG: hypothetical protein PHD32_01260 [Eubacteriales bacterium]|nr:hypothetical protein [Eubacteriales bacterium]
MGERGEIRVVWEEQPPAQWKELFRRGFAAYAKRAWEARGHERE